MNNEYGSALPFADQQIKVKDFSEMNKDVIKNAFTTQFAEKVKRYTKSIREAEKQLGILKKKLDGKKSANKEK